MEEKDKISTKISILYDHYKETVSYLKKDITIRDKNIKNLFCILILYTLFEFQQIDSKSVFSKLCEKYLGISLNINYALITTSILLLILIYAIRYFQMCMNIERQYNYIHHLENTLQNKLNENLITREGYSYLENYPLLSAFIHRIYNFIFPAILILLMILKSFFMCTSIFYSIHIEFTPKYTCVIFYNSLIPSLINLLISLSIILTTILYMLFTYRDKHWILVINNIVKKIFVHIHLYSED